MDEYLTLVTNALENGIHKPNRTGVDTISTFHESYEIDLGEGYPLLTTKQMDGFRWDSMIHEVIWYLSGEHHIRSLSEKTGIWDAWADENGNLDTAYGRFWRRYPVPDAEDGLSGEAWPHTEHRWSDNSEIDVDRWLNDDGTFDQLQYVLDMLEENPHSRRLVVNAWHPANATVSTLPPCHYTFVFNVQGDDTLNVHLTQRSGDIALGIPFNIAAYSLLAQAVAQRTEFELGKLGHTIVDAHIYCGTGDRGDWYADNLAELRTRVRDADHPDAYLAIKEWVEANAPAEDSKDAGLDHVPGLLEQCSRIPYSRPSLKIADKPLDELEYDDIELRAYESHPGLDFSVAE